MCLPRCLLSMLQGCLLGCLLALKLQQQLLLLCGAREGQAVCRGWGLCLVCLGQLCILLLTQVV